MRQWTIAVGVAVLLLATSVAAPSSDAAGKTEPPDWWQAQKDVTALLFEARRDIADLVGEVLASKPETGQEAMFNLNVLLRAGMNKPAVEMVELLAELCPKLAEHQISATYRDAWHEYGAWAVAQRVVEVSADRVGKLWLENNLLKHFLESGQSVEEIDAWLAEMPPGRDGFWIKERMRFNMTHDRGEALIRELSMKVRENPADIEEALTFLDALLHGCQKPGQEGNLGWVARVVEAGSPTEAESVASRLSTLEQWEPASAFYRQAVATPLSDAQANYYSSTWQAMVSSDVVKATFAANAREGLAKCLMGMGRNAEAQKWMVEAADIRDEHKLGMNALFAGTVQRESGVRVIEARIAAEEEESQDDPDYWRKRAQYYRGRAEPNKEEEALVNALALTKPEPLPDRTAKGHMDMRARVLGDYAHFLRRNHRAAEAVTLLRKEMAEAPVESASSARAARLLAFDFEKQLSTDDEVLWNWLSKRANWGHTAERLLWRMLEKAQRSELHPYFSRAEKMTKDSDASRSQTLGWIMNRMGFPRRSIPLLEHTTRTADNDNLRERAWFALFESYLDLRDWESAERIFPEARKRLTIREQGDWYARIAVAAAVSGHKAEAMRIWRVSANADPARPAYLSELAECGLREELAAFYRALAEKLPESEAPGKALKMLQQR